MEKKTSLNIVKRYDWSNPRYGELRISNKFYDCYFATEEFVDFPLHSLKIIFQIIWLVKHDQFFTGLDKEKEKSFKDLFLRNKESYAEITIRNSTITDNSAQLRNAFYFLENHRIESYQMQTENGQSFKYNGGLVTEIKNKAFGYTSFLVSSYWMEKILNIFPYNSFDIALVMNSKLTSSKWILFALWLNKLPDYGNDNLLLENLNKRFGLRYNSARDLCSKFLRRAQEIVGIFNHKNFIYTHKNGRIEIKPVKNTIQLSITSNSNSVSKRIYYIKKRHHLNDEIYSDFLHKYKSENKFRTDVEAALSIFKLECRAKGIKLKDFRGNAFLHELQRLIRDNYLKTKIGQIMPEGYLRLADRESFYFKLTKV